VHHHKPTVITSQFEFLCFNYGKFIVESQFIPFYVYNNNNNNSFIAYRSHKSNRIYKPEEN